MLLPCLPLQALLRNPELMRTMLNANPQAGRGGSGTQGWARLTQHGGLVSLRLIVAASKLIICCYSTACCACRSGR